MLWFSSGCSQEAPHATMTSSAPIWARQWGPSTTESCSSSRSPNKCLPARASRFAFCSRISKASRGDVLWNFLYGNVIIGGVDHTIQPGETYEFEVVWELNRNDGGTVAEGDYLVFSVFYPLLPPALVSETRSITIIGE